MIGSFGIIGGVAATPIAQKGTDAERAQQTTGVAQRQTASADQAANAAGIAETDGREHSTHERDADGRREWQMPGEQETSPVAETPADETPVPLKDPTGVSGNQLDLLG